VGDGHRDGKFTPSIYKFDTFSAIYNRRITELVSYYGLPIGDLGRYRTFIGVPKTHLLDTGSDLEIEKVSLQLVQAKFRLRKRISLPESWKSGTRSRWFLTGSGPAQIVYGYIVAGGLRALPSHPPGFACED